MLFGQKARIIVQRHAVRVSLPTLTLGAVIFGIALCWSGGPVAAVWPKPLTEMTVVKLSYQLKLTNHTILYK